MIVVRNEDFEWIEGTEQIAKWTKPESEWETWFCKTCGARVPGHNDPSRMFVPAGLLNEDGNSLRAVSYTHLDVYKRQVLGWVCSEGTVLCHTNSRCRRLVQEL